MRKWRIEVGRGGRTLIHTNECHVVEELIVTQESVRNKLEIDKDNVTAALCEISNRGESLVGSFVAR